LVIILSLVIYFLDVFYSKDGLTLYGIISFTSIGFYPSYFFLKKTKKIYKNYLSNRAMKPQLMPTEPPAICASGQVQI